MNLSQESKTYISATSKEFSNLILNSDFEQLIEIVEKNNEKVFHVLVSDNVENIETGISGFLFFLLEYYKYTENDIYLKKAELIAENLISYCKNTPTYNYSLYSGRAGFVYFLMQLYAINKNDIFLQECENLILPAENEYLTSAYTSDYLYNGRAGVLLVMTGLFQITGSGKILQLIAKFVDAIIQNAVLTEHGISWKAGEEINLRNSCGFAMGASGIQYVFKNLDLCFPNESFGYLVAGINKYKQSCWDKEVKNWLNFEKDILNTTTLNAFKSQYKANEPSLYKPSDEINWSSGSLGILLVEDTAAEIIFEFRQDKSETLARNIFDGLSGIGLSLLENKIITDRSAQLSLVQQKLLASQMPVTLDGGLFFGELGVSYFLLKSLMVSEYSNSVIKPTIITNELAPEYVLNIDLKHIRKALLSKIYTKTFLLTEKIFNQQLNDFLNNAEQMSGETEIEKFEKFINEKFINDDTPVNNVIADVFIFEKKKKEFGKKDLRTNLEIYLNKLNHSANIIRILNNPDEWILNQKLKVSDKVEILTTKWDWEPKEDFNFFQNFYNVAGTYEFLFQQQENVVIEYPLRIDGLVLHRFDQPKKIIDALIEIKFACQSLPEQVVMEFAKSSGSIDVQDFIKRLDFLVLYKVKQFLCEDILKIV